MSFSAYRAISDLLAQPTPAPHKLYAAAQELAESFAADEYTIEYLPPDASDLMIRAYQEAAGAGIADAYLRLALLYRYGGRATMAVGVDNDQRRAIEYYRLAESGGLAVSFQLAESAYYARLADIAPEAVARVERLLRDDPVDADAAVLLGYMHDQGYGMEQNSQAAVVLFERASAGGNHDAAFEMSLLHFSGRGTPVDDAEGLRWTRLAADLGSDRAMYNLGAFYAVGRYGLVADAETAVEWYVKAAEIGHGKAAFTAGLMLLRGDDGLDVDLLRAAQLFEMADRTYGEVDFRLASMGLERP
ncbi:sel1 repeat family protein [Gordonia sp. TBRC 11910]|uniref:Sel1 repeat family protein n=1 Tax=Gordonia asplenii TaxID=2725283 RepID=A0A848KUV8_9ACTN|nr:tetratricopeptide repeat protein [Gordonia asplenii]NMO02664.1 sel1 repeat family protein [Gordonia asplenii]